MKITLYIERNKIFDNLSANLQKEVCNFREHKAQPRNGKYIHEVCGTHNIRLFFRSSLGDHGKNISFWKFALFLIMKKIVNFVLRPIL